MKVTVELGPRSYDILIKPGLLESLPNWLSEYKLSPEKGLIVTDDKVDALYGYATQKRFLDRKKTYPRSIIKSGEESKSQEWLFRLYNDAIESGLDRQSIIIALGGGVVGDLAGYVAASFMRGIRYVQVPTTLLAMVDSAVGGKTGINLPQGKNLIGAFHQPSLVICDLSTLKSLPAREFRAGLAEVIKYGIIYDRRLFDFCDEHMTEILDADENVLEHVVGRSCQIKAEVVRQDETESGLRAILNFGHTLGHAIEAVAGYGTYLHGEAISIGMVFAARMSVKLSGLSKENCGKIERLLAKAGLPVRAPDVDWSALRRAMNVDKKTASGIPRFVLARDIGNVDHGVVVDDSQLDAAWSSL